MNNFNKNQISVFVVLLFTILNFCLQSSAQTGPPKLTPAKQAKLLFESKSRVEREQFLAAEANLINSRFFTEIIKLSDEAEAVNAVDVLRLVLPLAQRINDREAYFQLAYRLVRRLFERKLPQEGKVVIEQAQREFSRAAPSVVGIFEINIGSVYKDSRGYEKALPLLQHGRELLNDLHSLKADNLKAQAALGIAACHSELGNFESALKELVIAEALYVEAHNVAGVANVNNEYGVIYDLLQNSTLSELSYNKAIRMFQSLRPSRENTQRIALIKANLGLLQATGLAQYEKALVNLRDAKLQLSDKPSIIPFIMVNESIALRRLGLIQEGLDVAKKAFDLIPKDPAKPSDNYDDVGNAYSEYANALLDADLFQDALMNAEIAASYLENTPDVKWIALTTKGTALMGLKRLSEASSAFDDAISIVEDLESVAIGDEGAQARYFGNMFYPYYYRADLEIAKGDFAKALVFADRARAKTILSSVRGVRNPATTGMTDAQKKQEVTLSTALAEANAKLFALSQRGAATSPDFLSQTSVRDQAREQLERFHLNAYTTNPALKSRRAQVGIKSVDALKGVFNGGETIGLHYLVTPETVKVLIVTGAETGNINVNERNLSITGKELTERVKHLREFVDPAPAGGFRSEAIELYSGLIEPVDQYLDNGKTIAIVPDGILWDLPFQALIDRNGKYLIEKHPLFLAPSLFALAEMKSSEVEHPRQYKTMMLALGDPQIGRGVIAKKMGRELGPIPAAGDLVRELCQRFSTCDATFTRETATEKVLKERVEGARIVQLAAHGVFDNTSPLYSYIALAPTKGTQDPQDGLLETWEIMNLNLKNTDMLVLSACETARGQMMSGEGILGLTWAAFIGGCPTVIASQWNVNALSTNLLMKDFYSNLFPISSGKNDLNRTPRTSKAKALQQAMLSLIHSPRYNHPSFWAGFVAVGNAN